MATKLLSLASVTALTGIVVIASGAGCSRNVFVSGNEGGTGTSGGLGNPLGSDGGSSATDAKAPKDGSTTSDGSTPGDTCPSTLPIDQTQYAYKAAAKSPTACTVADINNLVTFVDGNPSATFAQVKASVTSATCKACLFTPDTGATWGAMLENAAGELVLINSGGCIEAKSNKFACGQAYHQFEQCLDEACVDCPDGDDSALSACYKAAAKGACKNANTAITSDCADAIDACSNLSTKYTFEAPAKALCAGQ